MTEHRVKTWPTFFSDVVSGKKKFELRVDDRGYAVGDYFVHEEWSPMSKEYSGQVFNQKIVYIVRWEDVPSSWGLKEGWCILGLETVGMTQNRAMFTREQLETVEGLTEEQYEQLLHLSWDK